MRRRSRIISSAGKIVDWVAVQVVRFVDETNPGFVECELLDAHGRRWLEVTVMQPVFGQEKANELIREFNHLTQQVGKLEKRLDKLSNVLRAVFELVGTELHLEPAALAEKLASVVREKAERTQAPCTNCKRPLGNKTKCIYCGTERPAESIFDLL